MPNEKKKDGRISLFFFLSVVLSGSMYKTNWDLRCHRDMESRGLAPNPGSMVRNLFDVIAYKTLEMPEAI